ncbi:hypothetical protein As57867_018632, partial [Aphanomyces stellatus]
VPAAAPLNVGTAAAPPPAATLNPAAPAFTSGFAAFAQSKGLAPPTFGGALSKAQDKPATDAAPAFGSAAPKAALSNPFFSTPSGSTAGLFFGKTNIVLPVPTVPDAAPAAVDGESEEQKRQERLLRFTASAKRAAPATADGATPAKKANTATDVDGEEETKGDADDTPATAE